MKNILGLFKYMLQGGLLVLLPLLIFILLVKEIIGLLVGIAQPIAALFPGNIFSHAQFPLILSLILLAGASLVIGLFLKLAVARRFGSWVESNTLKRVPMYNFVQSLTSGLVQGDKASAFKPAWLVSENDQKEIVYVVEDHGDGYMTVFVPWAPTAFSGQPKVVPKDRIEPMASSLTDVTAVLSHLGVGTQQLLGKSNKQG